MRLKTLLVINAVVCLVFGVAFVLVPGKIMPLYGGGVTPDLMYTGQLFGAALFAFAVLSWSARNVADSEARKPIVLAFFLGDLVGFVVALVGQLRGVINALGWSTVAIYLLLTIGFGAFQASKPCAKEPAA